MKKRLLSILIITIMLTCPVLASAFDPPEDIRAVPADSYFDPYYDKDNHNPFVTHYAPWLRNLHLMSAEEADNLKASGGVGGEACQMVRMFEMSPVNSDIMYFITNTSGIYATKTGGDFWYNVTNNMTGNDARGLWCDVLDANTVYASMRRDGFYRSKNYGASWELIIDDKDSTNSHRSNTITQDSTGNTYFATSDGIYRLNRSDDSLELLYDTTGLPVVDEAKADKKGPLWMDIEVSPNGEHIYAAVLSNAYSEATPGLYVSHDSGKTWSIKATNTTYEYNTYSIALHPDDPTKVYFTATKTEKTTDDSETEDDTTTEEEETAPGGTGEDTSEDTSEEDNGEITSPGVDNLNHCALYVSEDGGNTFTAISVYKVKSSYRNFYGLRFGPKNTDGVYPLYFCANQTNYPLRVSYDYGKSFKQVFSSTDDLGSGTIRKTPGKSYTGSLYQAFAPDMKNPGRIVFAANGIYEKTADGKFNRISGGFSGASVTDITFDNTGKPFFVTTDVGSHIADGVYKQNADGTYIYPTFKEGVDDHFTMAEFNPKNNMHIVACTGNNNGNGGYYAIRQSFDGGESFEPMEETAKLPISEGITNSTVIRFDGNNIYTSYFTSHDGGDTWERNTVDGTTPIFIHAVSKTNPKLMVGATGTTMDNCCFYRSEDGGESWTKIGTGYIGTGPSFVTTEFDVCGENGEDNGDWVWMVKLYRVYHYNIRTGEYTVNAGGVIPNAFSQISQNPNNPNHILLGSRPNFVTPGRDNKLSESYDGGKSWHTVPGLWGGAINEIKFVPDTTEVFIGTMSGVFIYDYEKFNYYAGIQLKADSETQWVTLPRVNDDENNVNDGEYIIAPEYTFNIPGKKFSAWKYNGELYQPGEKIELN